jgi:hypothetical protein
MRPLPLAGLCRLIVSGAVALALAAAFGAASASARLVWLCRPGARPDPCTPGLSTTLYNPPFTQVRGLEHPRAERSPAIDCFYVYPTVSQQPTANANLAIQNVERSIALYQVARYSQYCRVFAPMYRQVTLAGIGSAPSSHPLKPNGELPVQNVTSAFEYYLHHYSHGRGFVLIGHSQGALVLEQMIARVIDPNPGLRRRLVSAILMGGNVLVKDGRGIGGTFKHIPACRSARQLGCVIAFSTFDQPVPTPSLFGRPTGGVNATSARGEEVLCTNPANLAGGSGLLTPIQPSAPFAPGSLLSLGIAALGLTLPHPSTVFWSAPEAYSGRCELSNGAHVLEITPRDGAQIPRPSPNPEWGLHLLDANVALGNLIGIVADQSRAYSRRRPARWPCPGSLRRRRAPSGRARRLRSAARSARG